MNLEKEIINIICDVLVLGDNVSSFNRETGLLGSMPEFDSVAVVTLITAIEEEFDCVFDDDEISAENFETIGTFIQMVEAKI